jgi:hypothetical protein
MYLKKKMIKNHPCLNRIQARKRSVSQKQQHRPPMLMKTPPKQEREVPPRVPARVRSVSKKQPRRFHSHTKEMHHKAI